MDEQEINVLLETLRESFVTIMKKYDLDKSDLVKKSRFLYTDNSIVILMSDYAEYIDEGRRAGKMPPVKAIIKWIRRSAVNVPIGLTAEDFAWAVAKSIERNGVRPRPFIQRLNEEVNSLVLKYIFSQVNTTLKKTLNPK